MVMFTSFNCKVNSNAVLVHVKGTERGQP